MKIKTIVWLTIFGIAMAYMESAVVIYLRKIYYPDGFQFPLVPLDASIELVEVLREAATIIMLVCIAVLSAKKDSVKFAYFIFCFAVWDLFYYFFLWLFLGWPESLFTWDILFLIPVPWVGPVIAPCIVSITMMLLALSIIYFQRLGVNTRMNVKEWSLLIIGSFVIIVSFLWDYMRYLQQQKSSEITDLSAEKNVLNEMTNYVPADFNWALFLTGESLLLFGIILFINRMKKGKQLI